MNKNKNKEKIMGAEETHQRKQAWNLFWTEQGTIKEEMKTWEIFFNVDADDNNYKWRKINTSNDVIKPLPPSYSYSHLPHFLLYNLLLHASASHIFQLQGTSFSSF